MKFKALLPDTFLEVEAETEREAQLEAIKVLVEKLQADDFIVWEQGTPSPRAARG